MNGVKLLDGIFKASENKEKEYSYFVSTKPGHFKVYCSKYDSFWCCTGTGMENPAKYIRNIYYEEDNKIYINLFISSSMKIEGKI